MATVLSAPTSRPPAPGLPWVLGCCQAVQTPERTNGDEDMAEDLTVRCTSRFLTHDHQLLLLASLFHNLHCFILSPSLVAQLNPEIWSS